MESHEPIEHPQGCRCEKCMAYWEALVNAPISTARLDADSVRVQRAGSETLREYLAREIREARGRSDQYRADGMTATALIEQGRVCALAELAKAPLARKKEISITRKMNTPLQTSTTQEPARQVGPLVRPRYWVCVIGPIPHGALPEGADLPPRISARRAVEESTGCETSRITNSGWCDEAEYLRIMDARYGPNES